MCGTIPPLPQCVFMVWCLVTHRDNFTFYLKLRVSKEKTSIRFEVKNRILHSLNRWITYGPEPKACK
jgi:hypothetical protein